MSRFPPFSGTGENQASRALSNASQDLFSSASGLSGNRSTNGGGFNGTVPPTQSGNGTRASQIRPNRDAFSTRQVIKWMIPEQPIVSMYINPNRIQYNYSKQINETRVKGGVNLQYWGENLSTLTITGTTGTSGIEGINVLYDIYRNEQLMFDPYALFLEAERDKAQEQSFSDMLLDPGGLLGSNGLVGQIAGASSGIMNNSLGSGIVNSRSKPTLASLAFTVEMYWSGEIYRGYFTSFDVTESADSLGIFEYSMSFKVTQRRGYRTNYLAWHKHPSYGQSNSGVGGPPHSFGGLVSGPAGPVPNQNTSSIFDDISSGVGKIVNNIQSNPLIDAFLLP